MINYTIKIKCLEGLKENIQQSMKLGGLFISRIGFFLTNCKYHLLIMLFEYKAVFLCLRIF